MFISKKDLNRIKTEVEVLQEDSGGIATELYTSIWDGIKDSRMKINMLMDYLNLEITKEPEKKYIRKKVKEVQKKS